jgi:predicted MFS family arabinose efflux permease
MPWTLVVSLSTAQLVSWGSIFYAFALFMDPMGQDLGWSKPALTAAYSLGLVASGFGAVPVGRWIDLGYGRAVMTAGSITAAALLALWSQVTSYPAFVALWIGLGLTMSAVLYEPGFAVLTRTLGLKARRGITVMTLLGGLASTVFIPLTHLLVEWFGWRGSLLVLAGLNLGFCAAIHVLVIPPQRPRHARQPDEGAQQTEGARRVLGSPAFWGFVATTVLQGFVATGIPMHFLPLLVERGFTLSSAVTAYAVVGAAQVAARLVTGLGERILSLKVIGLITMLGWALSLGLLPFVPGGSWAIIGFAALYGAANGMMTILRALLPPELFGQADYGTIQGMIATPVNFTRAAAPFAFGALWAWWGGYGAVLVVCFLLAAAALAAFLFTLACARRL